MDHDSSNNGEGPPSPMIIRKPMHGRRAVQKKSSFTRHREVAPRQAATSNLTPIHLTAVRRREVKRLHSLTNLPLESIQKLVQKNNKKDPSVPHEKIKMEVKLNKMELKELLKKDLKIDIEQEPELLDALFSMFDRNHDGSIETKEVIAGLTVLLRGGTLREKLKLTFNLFDPEGWGDVTREQLEETMMAIGRAQYEGPELREFVNNFVEKAFANDADNDGRLDFEEFATAAENDSEISSLFTLETLFNDKK